MPNLNKINSQSAAEIEKAERAKAFFKKPPLTAEDLWRDTVITEGYLYNTLFHLLSLKDMGASSANIVLSNAFPVLSKLHEIGATEFVAQSIITAQKEGGLDLLVYKYNDCLEGFIKGLSEKEDDEIDCETKDTPIQAEKIFNQLKEITKKLLADPQSEKKAGEAGGCR